MSLTEKYRPTKWEDFIGQEIAVNYLRKLADDIVRNSDKSYKAKAIIIHGPYGASKTSLARAFAEYVLENSKKDTIYDEMRFGHQKNDKGCMSIKEYDCSSDEIVTDSQSPFNNPNIWHWLDGVKNMTVIFDEIQELSPEQMGKLLKPIENAADGVIYFLLTTNIEKINEALVSRSVVLETRLLNYDESMRLLKTVCKNEDFAYEEQALQVIALKANGHPRDLVKNLEMVHDYCGEIRFNESVELLNLTPPHWVLDVFVSVFTQKPLDDVFGVVDGVVYNPVHKIKLMKEFLIWFKYRVAGSKTIIKKEFNYFPKAEIDDLQNAFDECVKCAGVNAHDAMESLVRYVSLSSVNEDVGFHKFLEDVYNLVNRKKFCVSNCSVGFVSINEPRFKGRKIVKI